MLIVVDVWIIYWWYEGNMFVDHRHDVCQVQKKNYCCFGLVKAELLHFSSLIVEMKSKRCKCFFKYFLKSNFFGQRPNTCHSIYAVIWLSCSLKTEIDSL